MLHATESFVPFSGQLEAKREEEMRAHAQRRDQQIASTGTTSVISADYSPEQQHKDDQESTD